MSDTGSTTATGPAAGSLAADPAFLTFDADTQGAFKNHGWDTKTPAEAAAAALKSFRDAEKFIGIPKDRVVAWPKDATDEAGWKSVRARLGVPEDSKGYDFKDIKQKDGADLDPQFTEAMSSAFLKTGVPKDAAPELTKAVVAFMEKAGEAEAAESSARLATERASLAKDWGANMEPNKFIATQAAVKLGLTPEVVNALENAAGYKATLNALLKMGQMMGEDKFVANPNSAIQGVMSREQAVATYNERKQDAAWVAKVNSGDFKAMEEWRALTTLMTET